MRKLATLCLFVLAYALTHAQFVGCDTALIRSTLTGAGYIYLPVPNQPCSMYFINPTSQSSVLSQQAAQVYGAHTVSFQTAQENQDVLTALYSSAYSPANYAIWIGLGDGASEGNFGWLDGSPLNYTNWASGEPNNQTPSCCNIPIVGCVPADSRCQQGEDCVQMYGDGKWNDLGCDATSISLIEVSLCPQLTVTPDSTICNGSSITLSVKAILGSTPYTYNWNPGAGSSATFPVSPTAQTTYTIDVTDRWGCKANDDVTVSLQSCTAGPPGCRINDIRTAFTGAGYIELNVLNQPCSMYFINPQSQSSTASEADAQVFGAHMVSYQTAQENQDVINALNQSAYPPSSYAIWIGFSDGASEGNFVWLDGAPVNYTNWASGEPNDNKPSCCNIPLFGCSGSNPICQTGEDCVQMYADGKWNDLSCGDLSISVIEVNLCPQLTIPNDTSFCAGGSARLNATAILGSTPYTFTWNPGSLPNPSIVSPANTTTYSVHLTDRWGCVADDSLTVSVLGAAPESFTVSPAAVCAGEPVTVTYTGSSPANLTYNWNFDGGTVVSGSGQGPYTITYNSSGTKNITLNVVTPCPGAQASQQVVVNAIPVANAGADQSVCSGGQLTLGAGNNPNYTYAWLPTAGLSSATVGNPTFQFVNPTSAPIVTPYVLTVTENGCSDTDTVEVTLNPAGTTTITAGGPTAFCNGGSVVISATATFNSYLWSDNSTGNSVTATQAGDYYMAGIDANGCSFLSDTVTVTITPNPTLQLDSSRNVSCAGLSDGMLAVSVVNGTSTYNYVWSTTPPQTATPATGLAAGSYDVVVTDADNCTGSATYTITEPLVLNVTATVTDVSCFDDADGVIAATATGGTSPYSFIWSNTTTANPATNLVAGSYSVTVVDVNTCTTTGSYNVAQPAELDVDVISVNNIGCAGSPDGAVQVSASGGTQPYSYVWNTGSTGSSISGLAAGTYIVTVTDANNCTADTAAVVAPATQLAFNSIVIENVKLGEQVQLNIDSASTPGSTYKWNPSLYLSCSDCANPVFSAVRSIDYTVTVTNSANCDATGTVKITVLADKHVFIPNTFTPNGDGFNDYFYIYSAEQVNILDLTIFNRWGEKVFDSNNILQGWDGTYNAKDAAPGVYTYVARLTFIDGESTKKIGTLTLVR